MSEKEESAKLSIASERRKVSPQEAREAAAESRGFLASITIVAGDEEFEVPQRALMDDDQRDRMDQLDFESQSWDREPDVQYPERRFKDNDGNETIWPAHTEPGQLKTPYQKDGQRITPPYPVQIAIALWGKAKYERFKKAGGRATDVTATLGLLDERVTTREQGDGDTPPDPKSVGGDS